MTEKEYEKSRSYAALRVFMKFFSREKLSKIRMQELLENHEKLVDKQILFEEQITATLALNTGPGLVGVVVMRDPDE